jgi:PAS domain S-box-containing protein
MSKKSIRRPIQTQIDRKQVFEYFELALEIAQIGVWDCYLDDGSVTFGRHWAEMLGLDYSLLRMDAKTWEDRVHPDDLIVAKRAFADYISGKTKTYENIHRLKHADGHWVHVLSKGRYSAWGEDGKPTRFTGTLSDVSTFEQYRKKLSLFFENSPFGYAFCDMNGNFLEINERYAQITGYTLEELKELAYWDITPAKYEVNEAQQIEAMKKTGRYGPYRKEYRTKSGDLVPVELNGFIVEDYSGTTGIWSTVEDISEKRLLESQLIHSSKLASLGVLAAGVGHEINNPLAIIASSIDRLATLEPNNANVQADAKKIMEAVGRISEIVVGLRQFSRSESSYVEPIEIVGVIKETLSLMGEIIENQGVSVQTQIEANSEIFVDGNRGKFQQVFMNLLSNAKDATYKQTNPKIWIRVQRNENFASVIFRDNGIGITQKNIDKIFDPFFTTKGVSEGTGIGLSIVHSIVAEFGGEISVFSQPGEGTEFRVQLPISKHQLEPVHTLDDVDHSARIPEIDENLKGTILLLDDEPDILELLEFNIKRLGPHLKVFSFSDGNRALEAINLEPNKFDLIISDMKMPSMGGPEFLSAIRSQKSLRQPKFIFLTGGVEIDLESYNETSPDRIDGFIYKPFQREQLLDLIASALA